MIYRRFFLLIAMLFGFSHMALGTIVPDRQKDARGMLKWYYDGTATTATDPGTGKLKFNDANPALAGSIYIDDSTSANLRVDSILGKLAAGDMIWFQDQFVPTEALLFRVTSTVDSAGHWLLNVVLQAYGGNLIDDGDTLICQVFTYDDAGTGSTDSIYALYQADVAGVVSGYKGLGDTIYVDTADGGGGSDTVTALGDATASPGDTVDWRGDSVAVNSSNDTTWIKSNDALIIDAAQVGEGAGAVIVGSDTLRADDSGLTYLGLANRPWGLFYQTQLYLLETTGTDSWIPVNRVGPATGQVLKYNGTTWGPAADDSTGGTGSTDSLYVTYQADVASKSSGWVQSGDSIWVDSADATGAGGSGDTTTQPFRIVLNSWSDDSNVVTIWNDSSVFRHGSIFYDDVNNAESALVTKGYVDANDSAGGSGSVDSFYVKYVSDVASVTEGKKGDGDTIWVDTADATGAGGSGDTTTQPFRIVLNNWSGDTNVVTVWNDSIRVKHANIYKHAITGDSQLVTKRYVDDSAGSGTGWNWTDSATAMPSKLRWTPGAASIREILNVDLISGDSSTASGNRLLDITGSGLVESTSVVRVGYGTAAGSEFRISNNVSTPFTFRRDSAFFDAVARIDEAYKSATTAESQFVTKNYVDVSDGGGSITAVYGSSVTGHTTETNDSVWIDTLDATGGGGSGDTNSAPFRVVLDTTHEAMVLYSDSGVIGQPTYKVDMNNADSELVTKGYVDANDGGGGFTDTAAYLTADPGGAEWVGYNPTGNYFTPWATHDVDIGSTSFHFSSSYIDSGFFGNRAPTTETPNDRNVIFASDSIDAAGSQQTNGIMVAMVQTGQSSAIQSGIVGIMRPKPTVNDTVDESRGVRGILLKDGQGDLLKGIAVLGEFRTDAGDSNSGSHIVEAWGVSGRASLRDSSDAEQLFSLYGERPYVVDGHGAQADLAIGVGGQQPKDSGITNGFALFLERAGTGALSGQWPIKMAFRDTAGGFHTIQYDHRDARVEFSDPIHVTGSGEVTARMTVGDALVVDSLYSIDGAAPIQVRVGLVSSDSDITGVERLEADTVETTKLNGTDVVDATNIATGAVNAAEIGTGAVSAEEVLDGSLVELDLALTNAVIDNGVLTANTGDEPDDFTWEAPLGGGSILRATTLLGATNWRYNEGVTTDTDPTSGVVQFDNATVSVATIAYIDDVTFAGLPADSVLRYLHTGDMLWVGQIGVPADQMIFKIDSLPTDGTGYWKLPIAYIDGIADFTDEDTLIFNFIHARDSAGGGGSGTGDTLIWNVSGTEYSIVSNRIKMKAGTGITFTRADSTGFDDITIASTGSSTWVETNSGSDTSHAWKVAASDADTAMLIQKVEDSNIVRLHPGDLSATKVLHVYGEGGTVNGDTTGDGTFRVVTNSVVMLDINDDSIDVNLKDILNVDSADIVKYTDGSVGEADVTQGSLDSTEIENAGVTSTDLKGMVSDSLARILSDENGTAGGFVRSTVASDLTLDGVDIQGPVDSLGADTVVVNNYFSPPSEYVYLTNVHGFGRALSDEIYLQANLQTPNGDTTYLVRDSAGNITAGDQDTVNISGVVPWNCTVESLTVFYVISTGSEIVDNWLRGPDKTTFNNLTDSIYLTNATDLTSTSWATQHYTASNFAALGGHRFSWKYIVQLDTDNDRLRIGWVRLKVRRAG